MGFSRKEVYLWLETASDKQLKQHLGMLKDMFMLINDREQIESIRWLRSRLIEEIRARKEAKRS